MKKLFDGFGQKVENVYVLPLRLMLEEIKVVVWFTKEMLR